LLAGKGGVVDFWTFGLGADGAQLAIVASTKSNPGHNAEPRTGTCPYPNPV
jgi:hypothetical protein